MPFFKIIRPFNCFFTALSVLFGAFYLHMISWEISLFWVVLSAFFISAAGYVINDFFDLEIDKINRPDRILPAEQISPRTAYFYSIILFILGLLFAALSKNTNCLILAFVNTILLFYYAKYFKQIMILGNLVVAWAAASTFIFGAFATANLIHGIIPAVFAFLYTIIREFVKDAEDVEGDKNLGAKTLPVVAGVDSVIYASVIPFSIMVGFSIFLNRKMLMPFHTYILMNLLVNIPLLIYLIKLRLKPIKQSFTEASNFFKLNMIILLIVLLSAIINLEKIL